MRIRLLYFAWVREVVGTDGETLTLDKANPTVQDLCDELRRHSSDWENLFGGTVPMKFAVNQKFADRTTPLSDNCEVAIFPPVTGG